MENFETEVKKYKKTINQFATENTALTDQVKEADSGKFTRTLEIGKLKIRMAEMQRFMDSIPPDLYDQLKASQNRRTTQRGRE